jgi:hypothetical protein
MVYLTRSTVYGLRTPLRAWQLRESQRITAAFANSHVESFSPPGPLGPLGQHSPISHTHFSPAGQQHKRLKGGSFDP